METPLIGIKLPKTLKHWTEANTYFQLHRTSLPNVSDINNFTTSFQSLIYNYFASNYGTLNPSFSIDDCKKYFYNILHDPFHNKFRLSNWVPTLQQPTISCNIDPPKYHEIATVIRKCKLRASPCPLDQISIIVFKKCPMLRTFLHQLIVECWSKPHKQNPQNLEIFILNCGLKQHCGYPLGSLPYTRFAEFTAINLKFAVLFSQN
ncbi:hypothetical protein HELRODRAFT_178003 [Helobdella robusta]|uniref:Reverse transcriptase domain-containing protein n=1 Tax=Helobdella robusta TaxID=6412 RepID=T1FCL3_HELRO|nr:hypothetical protein HELRODRAFT_178003 [Helobdella robusta]ESN97569.1 hypothetical protein HELRODRAFT_178003 [Helobdella robusta]